MEQFILTIKEMTESGKWKTIATEKRTGYHDARNRFFECCKEAENSINPVSYTVSDRGTIFFKFSIN